jgi:hypothetical protein
VRSKACFSSSFGQQFGGESGSFRYHKSRLSVRLVLYCRLNESLNDVPLKKCLSISWASHANTLGPVSESCGGHGIVELDTYD